MLMEDASLQGRLRTGRQLIEKARRIVAFTGAGISTESGLSDFRSPGGVWDRYRVVTYPEFVSSREARQEYWRMKSEFYQELLHARPNPAHRALARLEFTGRVERLITQNIDGLHQVAGSSDDLVIELHGTNRRATCIGCGRLWAIADIQARLEVEDYDPSCEKCGNPIKPATVSFGQAMPEEPTYLAFQAARRCDLILVVGSSLQVEPAASIPAVAHGSGAELIIINRTATPQDHKATLIFRETASEVLDILVEG